jgi:hypothetical protein
MNILLGRIVYCLDGGVWLSSTDLFSCRCSEPNRITFACGRESVLD